MSRKYMAFLPSPVDQIEKRIFEPLSSLDGSASKWFKEVQPEDLAYFSRCCQIRKLLVLNDECPTQPFETHGLPFDRFLFQYSKAYKSTNVLARRLGIKMIPEVSSTPRCVTTFNPYDSHVVYTPIDRELRWSVARFFDSSSDFQPKRDHLDTLREFVTSAYHELNHRILFRTFVPAKLEQDFEYAKRYFAIVESLVMLRDAQISAEIGKASSPLIWLNVTYKSFKMPIPLEKGVLPLEIFRGVFTFLYAKNLGYSDSAYRKIRQRAGKSLKEFPILPNFYSDFIRNTVGPWFIKYQKHFEGRLELPPPTDKAPIFKAKVVPPENFMNADQAITKLYHFFLDLFEAQ